MAKRRLANILDPDSIHAKRARRRVVARVLVGQDVGEIARLEGVPVEQAASLVEQPVIRWLLTFWSWLFGQMRNGPGVPVLEQMAGRLLEQELEWGNHWIANLYARFLLQMGEPGRGLMAWVLRRFERLAWRNMVRKRRAGVKPSPRPAPTDEELFLREETAEMLAHARACGMHGGLDLRRLPQQWTRGVAASLFDQLCGLLEAVAPHLVPGLAEADEPPPPSARSAGMSPVSRPRIAAPAAPPGRSLQPMIDEIRARFAGWPRALLGTGARASPHPA